MKKTLLLLLAFVQINLFAQEEVLKLEYLYENKGLSKKEKVITLLREGESYTQFPTGKAIDTTYIDENNDIGFNKEFNDQYGNQFYQNSKTNTLLSREFVYQDQKFKVAIVEDQLQPMEWQILEDEKEIGSYQCKLAKSKPFRGRTYYIWYTEDIPLDLGVWKFNNLPGMPIIIESEDKNIKFTLQSLDLDEYDEFTILGDGEKMDFTTFSKIKKSQVDDFIQKLESSLPRGGKMEVKVGKSKNIEII